MKKKYMIIIVFLILIITFEIINFLGIKGKINLFSEARYKLSIEDISVPFSTSPFYFSSMQNGEYNYVDGETPVSRKF